MNARAKPTYLYLEHFQLKEAPFKITPTTEFFYGGGQRGEILHALLYALNVGEGIVMLTGEVGSGKTMTMRTMIEKLSDDIDVIYIANPSLSGREILYNICEELGLEAAENRPDTVRMLQNHLIEQHGKGRRVVAFIDEAQAMPDESLEEIRLLSNLETSRDKLLQIFLFGQPEFEDKIARQNMRQLRERISVKLKLRPFDRDDVREYIATRLRVAGYNGKPMFSSAACQLIAVVSQGLSRRINVLADKALLSAYGRGALTVNFADARRAVKDVNFGRMRYRSETSRRLSWQITAALTIGACLLLSLAVYTRLPTAQNPEIAPAAAASSEVIDEPAADAGDDAPSADAEEFAVLADGDDGDGGEHNAVSDAGGGENEENVAPVDAANAGGDATAANQRRELLTAIAALRRGEEKLDGDALATELAASAESHAAAPQTQGGAAEWQEVAEIRRDIVNNEKWDWMPASSYLRNRLNATETWLRDDSNARLYTARVLTVSRDRAVFLEKFLRYFADFYPLRNLMVYPTRLQSGGKFIVTYGAYESRGDAEIFIGNLPYYFTGGRPFAQTLAQSADEAAGEWRPLQ